MLITPESFLGDEYNRPQPYLAKLGLSIRRTLRPKTGSAGAMIQGYDQSFSKEVTFDAGRRIELKPQGEAAPLRAEGVRRVIAATGEVLYSGPDDTPAIVGVRSGRGEICYAAYSLERRSYARLLA